MTKTELSVVIHMAIASLAFGFWQHSASAGVFFYFSVAAYSAIRNARR